MHNQICEKYQDWTFKEWLNILWSGEASCDMSGTDLVACTVKPRYGLSTVKCPKLKVWGCFGYHGTGSLIVLPRYTTVNAHRCNELLDETLEYRFEMTV